MSFFSVVGSLGVPALNGSAPSQQSITMPMNPTTVLPTPVLPSQVVSIAPEPIGTPSECLLLKNMFDPATEVCFSAACSYEWVFLPLIFLHVQNVADGT